MKKTEKYGIIIGIISSIICIILVYWVPNTAFFTVIQKGILTIFSIIFGFFSGTFATGFIEYIEEEKNKD